MYVLYPEDSTDVQKYKLDIKTENEAFKMLIEFKARMPINKSNIAQNVQLSLTAEANEKGPSKSALVGIKSANIITDMRQPNTAATQDTKTPSSNSIYKQAPEELEVFGLTRLLIETTLGGSL